MIIKCKNCGKEFEKTKNRKFCSKECCTIYYSSQKNRNHKHPVINRCFWCRRKFGSTSFPNKKFCSLKCGEKYRKIRDRVYNIFQFDYETIDRELQKLEKMGNNYIFPNPHQDLNLFYELKGDNNIE